MTTAQKLDSITTELRALNLQIGVQISTARAHMLNGSRHDALLAIIAANVKSRRIGACISDLLSIQPGTAGDTPSPTTHPSPASTTAPGPAYMEAGAPVVQGCSTGTRGGICSNCGERTGYLTPSLNSVWLYCVACADEECREEAPAVIEDCFEDLDMRNEPDPDAQREEWLDRRREAQA